MRLLWRFGSDFIMPRGPRLDAPGVLHHVMARGIMRQAIFRDDSDRNDFVACLGVLAGSGAFHVYAWALLPNYFHLLVRTGQRPLACSMRSSPKPCNRFTCAISKEAGVANFCF